MNTIEFLTKQFVWQSKFLSKKIENSRSRKFFIDESELIITQLMLKQLEFNQTKPAEEKIVTHIKNNVLSLPEPKQFTFSEAFYKKSYYQSKARQLFLDVLESYDKRFMRGMQ